MNLSTVGLFWAFCPKRPLLLVLYFMAFSFYHLKAIFGQHIATAMYKKNVIVQNATYDTLSMRQKFNKDLDGTCITRIEIGTASP